MGLRLGLLIVAVYGTISGCTDRPTPAPVVPASVAQPTGPVSVSGTFNGVMQLTQGIPISCGTEGMLTLSVANNAFSYTLNQPQVLGQPTRTFNVMIAPNGSFQAASGAAYIQGTASTGHMAGDIVGDACGYHFEADNWVRGKWMIRE